MTREQLQARFHPVLAANAIRSFDTLLDRTDFIEVDGDDIILGVGDQDFVIEPPSTESFANIPKALARFLTVCRGWRLGELGEWSQIALHDGFSGTMHMLGQEAMAPGELYSEDLCSPIDIGFGAFVVVKGGKLYLHDGRAELLRQTDPVAYHLQRVVEELG